MNRPASITEASSLKLSVYFGERERAGGRFAADALFDLFAERELSMSVLMRGVEGFGTRHSRQTSRLLTLSEDLPMVAIAVDHEDRIRACLDDVAALFAQGSSTHGLKTLEPVRLADDGSGTGIAHGQIAGHPDGLGDEVKLTVYSSRHGRSGARAAHLEIVDALHRNRVAGASSFLGVDGTVLGARRRASFISANREVPTVTVAVGGSEMIERAIASISDSVPAAFMTLEPVRVLRRDGVELAAPASEPLPSPSQAQSLPTTGEGDHADWRSLTLYCGEQSRHGGAPLYPQAVRELRRAGAIGATALRGIWGYHGDHRPHGDRPWELRRRVPVAVIAVDRRDRFPAHLELISQLTDETGLLTVEDVPSVL